MKIAIDTSRANRLYKTGTEWYSYYLIINIIKLDKENSYILYSDKNLSESFLKDLDLENNTHVKVKVLKWPFKFLWTLGRMSLEMIFFKPDILFVPSHVMPFCAPKKSITTIHDVAFVENKKLYCKDPIDIESNHMKSLLCFFIRVFSGGKKRARSSDYLDWSTRFALKNAKKIICVSNFTKQEILKNYNISESKLAVVHNGYNNQLYRPIDLLSASKEVLDRHGLDFEYFLYVGRIEKKKNISRLLEGFKIYRENNPDSKLKLVLVGNIGYGSEEITYLISELELYDKIVMLGWVDEFDMPYLYNKAKAFVFPTLYEGFGIPIIEAMACGVPVIASDIPVLKEVGSDIPVFFNPYSVEDIALKMEQISLSQFDKQKSIDWASNYSWHRSARETLEEIKSLYSKKD